MLILFWSARKVRTVDRCQLLDGWHNWVEFNLREALTPRGFSWGSLEARRHLTLKAQNMWQTKSQELALAAKISHKGDYAYVPYFCNCVATCVGKVGLLSSGKGKKSRSVELNRDQWWSSADLSVPPQPFSLACFSHAWFFFARLPSKEWQLHSCHWQRPGF